jgi:hypothetical protein
MAKVEATKPADIDPQDREWVSYKLFGIGGVTLLIALSIIIYMGSRLGGCMYLDGSQ